MHRQDDVRHLEALLCLKITGDHYESNIDRCNVLFATLSQFWNGAENLSVSVLMPPDELAAAEARLLRWPNITLKFIDENLVIAGITQSQGRAWLKQQALKIAACQFLSSAFYLVLDPDLICCKPFGPQDLIRDNKALTAWEPKNHKPSWWRTSALALELPETPNEVGLSVTPNILAKDVSRKVIQRLEAVSHKPWWEHLLSVAALRPGLDWTEYTLYTTVLQNENLVDEYHWREGTTPTKRLVGRNHIWFADQFAKWDPSAEFNGARPGYFLVCQSNSLVEPKLILERIAPFLRREILQRLQVESA